MANRHAGEVSLRLDRVRTLKFDLNAFAEFEDVMGCPIQQVFRNAGNAGMREMRALLWAGLLHEAPDMTLRRAGELADFIDGDFSEKLTTVMTAVGEAFQAAIGDDQKKRLQALKERARTATSPDLEALDGGDAPNDSPADVSGSDNGNSGD